MGGLYPPRSQQRIVCDQATEMKVLLRKRKEPQEGIEGLFVIANNRRPNVLERKLDGADARCATSALEAPHARAKNPNRRQLRRRREREIRSFP